MFGLSSRASALEQALQQSKAYSSRLENRVMFLQSVIGIISRNLTHGGENSTDIIDQWKFWRLNSQFEELLTLWKDKLKSVRIALEMSHKQIEQLYRHLGMESITDPPSRAAESEQLDFLSDKFMELLRSENLDMAMVMSGPAQDEANSSQSSSWLWFLIKSLFWSAFVVYALQFFGVPLPFALPIALPIDLATVKRTVAPLLLSQTTTHTTTPPPPSG